MHDQAQRTNGIGGFWHHRCQHKPELDGGKSTYGVQYQLLDLGRVVDSNHREHVRYRERTYTFN